MVQGFVPQGRHGFVMVDVLNAHGRVIKQRDRGLQEVDQ